MLKQLNSAAKKQDVFSRVDNIMSIFDGRIILSAVDQYMMRPVKLASLLSARSMIECEQFIYMCIYLWKYN